MSSRRDYADRRFLTDPLEARRQRAIDWLGERWLLHPKRRLSRLEIPLTEHALHLAFHQPRPRAG